MERGCHQVQSTVVILFYFTSTLFDKASSILASSFFLQR